MTETKVTDVMTTASEAGPGEATSPRKTYREKCESALRELDARLDELKLKSLEMTSGAREDIDGAMQALAQKRNQFVAKLADLRDASGDAWEDLKTGVDNSWDELEDAFVDLRRGVGSALGRFKEGSKS